MEDAGRALQEVIEEIEETSLQRELVQEVEGALIETLEAKAEGVLKVLHCPCVAVSRRNQKQRAFAYLRIGSNPEAGTTLRVYRD
jgi:hypothetical protein